MGTEQALPFLSVLVWLLAQNSCYFQALCLSYQMMVLKPDKRNGRIWQQLPQSPVSTPARQVSGVLVQIGALLGCSLGLALPSKESAGTVWTSHSGPVLILLRVTASASDLPMTSDTTAEKVAEWLERGGKAQAKCYTEYSGKGPTHSTFAEHLRVPAGTPTQLPKVLGKDFVSASNSVLTLTLSDSLGLHFVLPWAACPTPQDTPERAWEDPISAGPLHKNGGQQKEGPQRERGKR